MDDMLAPGGQNVHVSWVTVCLGVAVAGPGSVARPQAIGEPMSLDTHLDQLKERHATLESRITEEDQRPRPDSGTLTRLKLEKLRLKEEMERLRARPG
jgi:hypothetical protein